MRVTIGSADPGFEPILLDVKKNIYLTEEYYDKDDKSLSSRLCLYACYVVKGRWPEVESIIMKDPCHAYVYSRDIIMGRWPEAESIIMKDPWSAYWYAFNVIKGRWPEAEPIIMKDPEFAFYYTCWDLYCWL